MKAAAKTAKESFKRICGDEVSKVKRTERILLRLIVANNDANGFDCLFQLSTSSLACVQYF
jgi:hypothetical protein